MRNLKQGFNPVNAINRSIFKGTLILFLITSFSICPAQGSLTQDTVKAIAYPLPAADTLFSSGNINIINDTLFSKTGLSEKSGKVKKQKKIDTAYYSPKKAAIRAAACPGLGQIYNKKYWKLPIVYGVLGTVTYFVAANSKRLKQFNGYIRNYYDTIPNPSPYDQLDISELETYQNTYRKNVQIAAFGTLFAWGLSIVDAVVDAHLRSFDVSDNLSLKIKPQINTMDNSYYTGIALNLTFK